MEANQKYLNARAAEITNIPLYPLKTSLKIMLSEDSAGYTATYTIPLPEGREVTFTARGETEQSASENLAGIISQRFMRLNNIQKFGSGLRGDLQFQKEHLDSIIEDDTFNPIE